MELFTDCVDFAGQVFPRVKDWKPCELDSPSLASGLRLLGERLYAGKPFFRAVDDSYMEWKFAFLVEHAPCSHFDLLLALNGEEASLPDRMILLARTGKGFRGQKMRPWAAVAGNIHLVVFFRPACKVQSYHINFPILAAVSMVEAIDGIKELSGRAAIKWVNDILIGRAKVAGFITHVQTLEDVVKTAVLGIGINVVKKPSVESNPFVPEVTSLQAEASDPSKCSQDVVLSRLLKQLGINYHRLLSGQSFQLLDYYRKRCMVLGRQVRVLSDPLKGESEEVASGRVIGIGDNLELYINNREEPVRRGRLVLED
jgi:BirA family biotin operon repressor/biotin-[acetyl-CoA-carboxylase] ligase